MENTLNNMFNAGTEAETSPRGLSGTVQLTATASLVVNSVLDTIKTAFADYEADVKASQVSHDAMDALIKRAYDLSALDLTFIKELSDEDTTGMLKSQQSKRSRTKGKPMTMDNYRNLMNAAVSENLIRLATGAAKSAGGGASSTDTEYSEETLARLAKDQDALRKEIRNCQSKKSIAKSKIGFSEDSDRWKALLTMEKQLMDIRVGGRQPKDIVVDHTKEELQELLAGKDLSTMKSGDSKALLAAIMAKLAPKAEEVPAEDTNEQTAD